MGLEHNKSYSEPIASLQERLKESNIWFPYPALISVGLIMVLSGHLIPGLNPRLGNQAIITRLEAPKENEGSIWIGIFPEKNRISMITSDKKRFTWDTAGVSKTTLDKIIKYLKNRVAKESVSAGLTLTSSLERVTVVVSVDQRLKYRNISPILQAFAEAKISRYGFETKLVH